ncbi:hypothetical protein D5086_007083 [Populus alba]|uniref:Uncharacterized protein n=1 Tax=Populus alba TaxID=43335 RepID=A0ACC4CME4_POPAL
MWKATVIPTSRYRFHVKSAKICGGPPPSEPPCVKERWLEGRGRPLETQRMLAMKNCGTVSHMGSADFKEALVSGRIHTRKAAAQRPSNTEPMGV